MDDGVTAEELHNAWQDAVRAADLAERLAVAATEAARQADVRALGAAEIADLAEHAASASSRAAERARAAATEAADLAAALRGQEGPARELAASARQIETEACDAYQEQDADRRRPDRDPS